MSDRLRRRVAWSFALLCALLVFAWALLAVTNASDVRAGEGLGLSHQQALIALVFPLVGAAIASSRSGHSIGWIFLAIGLSAGASAVNELYLAFPARDPAWARWLQSWVWVPAWFLMLTFLPLLFPDGRLPSPRWRWLARLAAVSIAGFMLSSMLHPDLIDQPGYTNPFVRIGGGALLALEAIVLTSFAVAFACCAGAVFALIVRFRAADATQRQQIKWFVYAAVATALAAIGRTVLADNLALQALGVVSIPLIPVATGIAVFRYRLYDIDVLINKTLVYACLMVVLASVYVAGVVGVSSLLRAATGRANNDLVVAATTLLAAGLFRPARARIQYLIDRRFYRARYDAVRTLELFAARLRDETELDRLRTELVGVVGRTMQPTSVSLWLRP